MVRSEGEPPNGGESEPSMQLIVSRADNWGPLGTVVAPVLAGFALASVVLIGTTSFSGHPLQSGASTCFVVSAVALLFSMQMLALRRRGIAVWVAESALYEIGLLLLFVGLGLFLWPSRWSAASAIAVTIAFLAALVDVALTVFLIVHDVSEDRKPRAALKTGLGGDRT